MPKLRTPLLSLDATGTLNNSLTFTHRLGSAIAEKKPQTPNMRTLPQIYQRWSYQDYSYLWTQQSSATKAIYRALSGIRHTTPIAEWLRYCLSSLPDIAAAWHLDSIVVGTAKDWGKNANHGAVFGASITTGIIDRCLNFDGVDDAINAGHAASLDISEYTLEMFVKLDSLPGYGQLFNKRINNTHSYEMHMETGIIYLEAGGNLYKGLYSTHPLLTNLWYHLAGVFKKSTYLRIYINGNIEAETTTGIPAAIGSTLTQDLRIGGIDVASGYSIDGLLDEPRVYNRVLDSTEILRHSLRRYP